MPLLRVRSALVVILVSLALPTRAAEPGAEELERRFTDTVQPFLEVHRLGCHGKEKQKGKLDLSAYTTMPSVARDHELWKVVVERLEAKEMPPEKAKPQPTPEARGAIIEKRIERLPEDIREHMRLMTDIIALAFQADKTRIATLLLCRDLSGLFYPFLNVRMAHHPASHADESDAYERVSRFYVSQIAHLASRLDAMKEGEGTVLDNSCLLFISNMWSGSKHDSTKVPVLLAGSLGGTLKTGRVLDYTEKDDSERKLCSLYLSLMDRMGVPLDHFGDADTRLARL